MEGQIILQHINALGTVGGQITHTQKWFGYTHRGGQSNGPITHTKKLGILTELGIMDGQITRISWSGYNAWSGYSHTERVWVQWMVILLTHRAGLGIVGGQIPYTYSDIVWV